MYNTEIKLIDYFKSYTIEMLYDYARYYNNKKQNTNPIVARRIKNRTIKYLRYMYVCIVQI